MRPVDARGLLRRLAFADIRRRLRIRLAAWTATAFLGWSLALLAAAATDLGVAAFHAMLMGIASFLPAFLLFPLDPDAGRDAIRRIDEHASVEAWLGYPGGPAEKALGDRALEALTLGRLERWRAPRASLKVRLAITGIVAAALVVFAAAQVASLRAGYGLAFSYPEKATAGNRSGTAETPSDTTAGEFVPGTSLRDANDPSQEASRRRQPGPGGRSGSPGGRDPLADPGIDDGGERETAAASTESGIPDSSGDKPGQRDPGRTVTVQIRGAGGGSEDGDAPGAGGPDPTGDARATGFEGSGRALESSPIVDYRARFERQYADATGTETVLGDTPTPAALSKAVAAYYGSFDLRVVVGQPLDPAIARLQDAWKNAFGNGDTP